MHNYSNQETETLPVGMVFTVVGISNMGYSLKPVKKLVIEEGGVMPILEFSAEMIKGAFTESDYLPDNE